MVTEKKKKKNINHGTKLMFISHKHDIFVKTKFILFYYCLVLRLLTVLLILRLLFISFFFNAPPYPCWYIFDLFYIAGYLFLDKRLDNNTISYP